MAANDPINVKVTSLNTSLSDQDYTTLVKSTGVTMQCPVRIGLKKDGSDLWTLPLEPLVSVRFGKTIIRRNIAKAKGMGTVKEQFSQNDYEIQISGLLQGDGVFPELDFSKLQSLLVAGQSLSIRCKLLDILGVSLICVEGGDYPATPGLDNQEYSFTAYSDQYFELV